MKTRQEPEASAIKPSIRVALPASYRLAAHGDPVAQFEGLHLVLHPDGSVTWEVSYA